MKQKKRRDIKTRDREREIKTPEEREGQKRNDEGYTDMAMGND